MLSFLNTERAESSYMNKIEHLAMRLQFSRDAYEIGDRADHTLVRYSTDNSTVHKNLLYKHSELLILHVYMYIYA